MIGFTTLLLAGAVGAVARYLVSRWLPTPAQPNRVPRAVLVVNVVGSLIAGGALALGVAQVLPSGLVAVVITGLCGGLTTFSTFSVETIELLMQGSRGVAGRSILANVFFSLAAAAVGFFPLHAALP